MIKKFLAGILISGLIAGTGCGIGYGIKYNNIKKEYNQQQDTSGLVKSVAELQELVKTLNDEKDLLTSQIETLTSSNTNYQSQINNLLEIKSDYEETINALTSTNESNNLTLIKLNEEIDSLQNQVVELELQDENNLEQIATLNSQISTLQNLSSQLQITNNTNVNTISSLNAQITNLNTQISNLTLQAENNSGIVNGLQSRISELETSIAYYEQYISNLENDTQVVATFEFNGSVVGINILSKGSTTSFTNPTSTDYVQFNGWMVDGQPVDLNTYVINQNTLFVADVTYNYDVVFKVDNEAVDTQLISQGSSATLPNNPTKDGYEFDYWTTNGVDQVDPTTIEITQNTVFIAHFTKVHTVTYIVGDTTYTESVRNGQYAEGIDVSLDNNGIFNGWKYNNNYIDLSNYMIFADTTLVADISYEYNVTFVNEESTYTTQKVYANNSIVAPANPTSSNELNRFEGWSIDGQNIVDLSTYIVNSNVTFIAIYSEMVAGLYYDDYSYTWQELLDMGWISVSNGTLTSNSTSIRGSFVIDNSVTIIGTSSLDYLTNLTYVYIPDSVTSIRESAFKGCSSLKQVRMSKNIWSITNNAFRDCTSLESINLESVVYISDYAFYGCKTLTSVTIPSSATNLGIQIFSNCTGLISATVYCSSIPNSAFYNCTSLTNVQMENVESIGQTAFAYCKGLITITIPSSVTSIGKNAFNYCSNLETAYVPTALDVTSVTVFNNCPKLTIVRV